MKKILFLLLALAIWIPGFSQTANDTIEINKRLTAVEEKVEKMGKLKFSGYVQTQWTWDRSQAGAGKQNNFSVRRGRLKSTYSNQYGEVVLQIDVTENGVNIKDAYLKLQEPKTKIIGFKAGVFDRPFGHEITYSSSRRESPERSRVFLELFPKERDLGAEIILQGPQNTFLKDFRLNAGLFSGNGGQARETDSRKDFIGRLAYSRSINDISFGLGTSVYSGGVRLAGDQNQVAYKLKGDKFSRDENLTQGDYAKRQYFGFEGQFSVASSIGKTSLRGEYLWGTQPGAEGGSQSPTGAITNDIYSRNFNGYYIYLVQGIGRTNHNFVAKYDAYDPNTKLSGNECQTVGDISYSTLGLGWLWNMNDNLRLMCFYEIISNEKVNNHIVDSKYKDNISDDLFTLRLQYKF